MRTAVSNAASPRRLHWQAAFTTKNYQASSPVFWQHVFVSDTPMTNWSGGSSLFLNWALWKTKATRTMSYCLSPVISLHHFKSNLSKARVGVARQPRVPS